MTKATMVKQLSFDMPDRPGLLMEVSDALAASGIKVHYLCAWMMDSTANFMLIAENGGKAKRALSKMNITPAEEETVMVALPGTPASLRDMARSVSDAGLNMNFADFFVTGRNAVCVLSTSDDKKALKAINKPVRMRKAA